MHLYKKFYNTFRQAKNLGTIEGDAYSVNVAGMVIDIDEGKFEYYLPVVIMSGNVKESIYWCIC